MTSWLAVTLLIAEWLLRIGLSIRVITRRRSVGWSLSWLVVVLLFPVVGAGVYLLIGENRLGAKRAARVSVLRHRYEGVLPELGVPTVVDWSRLGPTAELLQHQAGVTAGFPALPGNELRLLEDSETMLHSLIADIDRAQRTCHLESFIWWPGGLADEVAEALVRAANRGVICRVLLDAAGSAQFFTTGSAKRLRQNGVELVPALPVSLIRMLFVRLDLRNHRKISVIDGEIAYTGSHNLADAEHFGARKKVGPWVDASVRIRGPSVTALGLTFLMDWELATGEGAEELDRTGDLRTQSAVGPSNVQVVPSGPGLMSQAIHELTLAAIYAARRELVMTTPYFVPDESVLAGLVSAAHRGVEVTVVLPQRNDHPIVQLASRATFDDLLAEGVRIARFPGGLLHSKTMVIDQEIGFIGSVNMDMRSFWLNFEITLFVYDQTFAAQLRAMQDRYLDRARFVAREQWRRRSAATRFAESTARLFGPVL